jgi:predicted ATP-dependent endonuclease of OLD family
LRLKRLELVGFKSFVEPTVIDFDVPIVAIVGPNGCGKSNVVDALRWVMGEMSAKSLRGRAMEDVIFNGSEKCPPLGMAEVSLTFSTEDGIAPADYAGFTEITVTRRLYRSGESEYLINKIPSRLRDIIDLFLGTGVGHKAYSIIEQGQIDFVISAKPEDRRLLIEEAQKDPSRFAELYEIHFNRVYALIRCTRARSRPVARRSRRRRTSLTGTETRTSKTRSAIPGTSRRVRRVSDRLRNRQRGIRRIPWRAK